MGRQEGLTATGSGRSQSVRSSTLSPAKSARHSPSPSGGRARQVILWDLRAGRAALNLQGPGEMVFSLAFSPDGHTLYGSGSSADIGAYDLSYYNRHIAGNIEHQLELRSDQTIAPAHAAAMRTWSAAILGGDVLDDR